MPDEIDYELFRRGVCDALLGNKGDMIDRMVQMYTSTAYPDGAAEDPEMMEQEVRAKVHEMQMKLEGGMFDAPLAA